MTVPAHRLLGVLLFGTLACYRGDFLLGLPCTEDSDCDPHVCVDGQCRPQGTPSEFASCSAVEPRVLIVLDTSTSMALDNTLDPERDYQPCRWINCENADVGALQSRIHSVRSALSMIAAEYEQVGFGLMTTNGRPPPSEADWVPPACVGLSSAGGLSEGEEYRFAWVTSSSDGDEWQPLLNPFGGTGMWMLCGNNRPYPYLRHDDMFGAAPGLGNDTHDLGGLPDAPLYAVVPGLLLSDYEHPSNRSRKVQWFPRFMGRRARLDCDDPLDRAIAEQTNGDYAYDEVCGESFYYWPYVDGFSGYSANQGQSADHVLHEECDANGNNCQMTEDGVHRLGVTEPEPGAKGALPVPFFSARVHEDPSVAAADKGPRDAADARSMFEGLMSTQHTGGQDIAGGSPLATVVGDLDNTLGPKPSVPLSNAAFAHQTVASYLSWLDAVDDGDICRPTSMIIIMDGLPEPWSSQGGEDLFERLAKFQRTLGVDGYVVGFTEEVASSSIHVERINQMACAAAGGSAPEPCMAERNALETCADPTDPSQGCAWLAPDDAQLEAVLRLILDRVAVVAR